MIPFQPAKRFSFDASLTRCKRVCTPLELLVTNFVFPALMFIAAGCAAQSAPRQSLLALSKADHTLAIVDPVSLKVVAKIPVGSDPHEVIASSDGKTAYVSIYGGGSLHEINIIDLVAKKPLRNFDTKPLNGPHGLDFAGGKLWFSAEGAKAVGRYDPATNTMDWCMGTGQDRTHMIYVTPDEKNIYTTNVSSGTVSILTDTIMPPPGGFGPPPGGASAPAAAPAPPPGMPQARRSWTHTVIPVGRGSEGFDVSPDGKELWTAASDDGIIWIIDIPSKKVVAKLDAKVVGANRLKFTTDGRLAFITSLRGGDLVIYDVKTRRELKKINIGHGAAGILMDPSGKRAFVASTADNYIAVVDLNNLAVTGHIDVGGGPDGLAWASQP